MALILGIESSSEICSVALSRDGEFIDMVETDEPFSHTRKMTVFIDELFRRNSMKLPDLDAISVSHGPGSYTGLRVSAATAKGLCYGLKKPLIAVNTLESLSWVAKNQKSQAIILPMIDARRMEVYFALYDQDLKVLVSTQNLILEEGVFDKYIKEYGDIILCGTGMEKGIELFRDDRFICLPIKCSSRHLSEVSERKFRAGEFEDVAYYEPYYYKSPNVTKSKKALF